MNIKGVVVLEDAAEDLKFGQNFYSQNGIEVGRYFFDCLISDIESLILYAGIHCKTFGFYRMLSKRFPYAIYYDIMNDIAYVTAILDMRRNPKLIKNTIKRRKS